MASQLKDKVSQLAEFFSDANREMAVALTGSTVTYHDLISGEDRDFWHYLCKKDFRRLEKLLTQSMGEGHFVDDSGEDDTDDEPVIPNTKDEGAGQDDSPDGDGFVDFRPPYGANVGKRPAIWERTGSKPDESAGDAGTDETDWLRIPGKEEEAKEL